jgi:hypothetical protein
VIFIVSTLLFAVGTLLLLRSAIAIAASLIVICYQLLKLAVCLVILAVLGCVLFCQWYLKHVGVLARWSGGLPEPDAEPFITINVYSDEDDVAPTIDLPRAGFHRLRG